jgi:predicted TIM-barrel fold metal-dependent hydrolase
MNGEWIDGRPGITFQGLAALRHEMPHYNALAIGMPGVGKYEHGAFKRACDAWDFEGIAALTTVEHETLEREFETIATFGFRGVKVHPRLLRRNTSLDFLSSVFIMCQRFDLVCLLCTYEADKPGSLPSSDPFYQICGALNNVPDVRLILMHGGGARILQFAGLARHSESILLDLSFTLTDFVTATLETSIKDLMLKLDRRLCIGSDSPEFTIAETLRRVIAIAGDLDPEKLENVLSRNLDRLFPGRIKQ